MSIKFITLTCEKYHQTRLKTIKETWGKGQDFVFLSDFNEGEDIVGFSHIPRGYEYVPFKYLEFFKYYNISEADWYFFTDDDTFVNIPQIESLLKKYDPKDNICLGHIGKLNPDGTDADGQQTGFPLQTIQGQDSNLPLTYVSGGAGFILSKKAFDEVRKYLLRTQSPAICYNGDVSFGFWLRGGQVQIIDILGFWWTNPIDLNHIHEQIKNSYTYHYVDLQKMNELIKITSEKFTNKSAKFTIITQIRNEEKRLEDWINYHKKIGVDEFIIFLDSCTDRSHEILENLSKTIDIKIRESIPFGTYPPTDDPSTYGSYHVVPRIKHSLSRGLKEVRNRENNDDHWSIFIEVDEYIVPQTKKSLSEVVSEVNKNRIYIASYDFKCPLDLNFCVYTQTYMRWSDNTRTNGSVNGTPGYFKNRGKSLVRTNFVLTEEVDIHDVDYSEAWQNNEILKLNHYRNNGELQVYDYEDKKILDWVM